jgi:hypothetical protein
MQFVNIGKKGILFYKCILTLYIHCPWCIHCTYTTTHSAISILCNNVYTHVLYAMHEAHLAHSVHKGHIAQATNCMQCINNIQTVRHCAHSVQRVHTYYTQCLHCTTHILHTMHALDIQRRHCISNRHVR